MLKWGENALILFPKPDSVATPWHDNLWLVVEWELIVRSSQRFVTSDDVSDKWPYSEFYGDWLSQGSKNKALVLLLFLQM